MFQFSRGVLQRAPFLVIIFYSTASFAQLENEQKDSLYISEVENKKGSDKVLHAEPLFIDLIRDLGARKGEKEWNFGLGLADNLKFDSYHALVEYEFAPIDRLGFEIELPFTFYSAQNGYSKDSIPSSKMESIKLASQWTFFVSEKQATSMAVGYIHQFDLSDFRNFGKPLFHGNTFNPFFVAAKRWGNNFHSLLYTGPVFSQHYASNALRSVFQINSNIHYMIPGTRNFVGIELNKELNQGVLSTVIRPQMRVGVSEHFLIGIVGGIPINREYERLSTFLRVIWEPH